MRAGTISPSSLGNTHSTSATVFCFCGDVIKSKYDPNTSRRGKMKSPFVYVCGLWCVSCAVGLGAWDGGNKGERGVTSRHTAAWPGMCRGDRTYVGISEGWKLDRTVLEYPNAGDWTGQCLNIRMLMTGPDTQ